MAINVKIWDGKVWLLPSGYAPLETKGFHTLLGEYVLAKLAPIVGATLADLSPLWSALGLEYQGVGQPPVWVPDPEISYNNTDVLEWFISGNDTLRDMQRYNYPTCSRSFGALNGTKSFIYKPFWDSIAITLCGSEAAFVAALQPIIDQRDGQ